MTRIPERYVEPVEPMPGNSAWLWGGGLYVASAVCLIIALAVIVADRKYVGADAYNLIINGLYALVWIGVAIVAAVIGAARQIVAEFRNRLPLLPRPSSAPLMSP